MTWDQRGERVFPLWTSDPDLSDWRFDMRELEGKEQKKTIHVLGRYLLPRVPTWS